MKKFLLLIALLSPLLMIGQSNKKRKLAKIPKLVVGFDYGGQFSGLSATPNDIFGEIATAAPPFKRNLGQQFNVFVGFNIWDNLELTTGIATNKMAVSQTAGFSYWACEPVYYGAKEAIGSKRMLTFTNIEMPVHLRYRFQRKSFQFIPSIGFAIGMNQRSRQAIEVYMDNGKTATHSSNDKALELDHKANFALSAKLGVGYRITDRILFKIEPFYKKYMAKEGQVVEHFDLRVNSFGINCGTEYALKMGRKK
jgi:opacity protein-like surface antigen